MKIPKSTIEYIKKLFFAFCLACLTAGGAVAQTERLRSQINTIIREADATVGVAVIFDGRDTLTVNNKCGYPTMSVYKFHQALAVLDYLDRNGLPLETELFIRKEDLKPDTYSPLRDARPEGAFRMSIGELLRYSISLSDNNACDVLFRYVGGTEVVDRFVAALGVSDVVIAATEEEMHEKIENQYLNHTSPLAAARLLELFRAEPLFAVEYKIFLMKTMLGSVTGPDKLKGRLPQDVAVAHKTGSASRDQTGMQVADNDVGIVRLPDGRVYSIAVFVMNSRESDETNAALIARISEAVFRYFSEK